MTRHLLVIGAQRCGTTYLHALLDAHPDITMARPARPEPKVFLSANVVQRGADWYRSTYFAHATNESVLGEKSTSYLEDGAAATRAASVLGSAEIVVQLRDPVARAVSNWRFSTANGFEQRPITEALEANLRGSRAWDRDASSVSPYAYLERGRYVLYLEPWLTAFASTVYVRFLEDVVARRETAADLYRVVGVDPDFQPPDEGYPINQSNGAGPEIDADLVRRLRAYFSGFNARLSDRLGRELPWTVS